MDKDLSSHVPILLVLIMLFSATGTCAFAVPANTRNSGSAAPMTHSRATSALLEFQGAGSITTYIEVLPNATITSATLTLRGLPYNGQYPTDLSLDIGADGNPDWDFKGAGYGALGRQTLFEDGSVLKSIAFTGAGHLETSFKVSPGTVRSATLNVSNQPPYPTYPSSTDESTAAEVTAIAISDLNHDGLPDIVYGCSAGLYVYKNCGDVAFTQLDVDLTNDVRTVAVSDLNNDGRPDLIAGCTSGLYLCRNDGDEQFTTLDAISAKNVNSLVTGDFNNDGERDLIAGCTDGLYPYRNEGDNAFAQLDDATNTGTTVNAVALGDLNNDGKLDLVAGNSNGLYIFANLDGNTFDIPINILSNKDVSSVAVADLDNNGTQDIVAAGADGLYVVPNIKYPIFADTITAATGAMLSIALDDVDNDGDIDLAAGSASTGEFRVYTNQGGAQSSTLGTFQLANTLTITGATTVNAVALGDMDKDGDIDAICGTQSKLSVMMNEKAAQYDYSMGLSGELDVFWQNAKSQPLQAATLLAQGSARVNCVAAGDLFLDGDKDLVTAHDSGIAIYKNVNGSYQLNRTLGGGLFTAVAIGDVDNDGDLDIAAASWGGDFCLAENDDGFSSLTAITASTNAMRDLVLCDVNNDGYLDIMGANRDGAFYLSVNENGAFAQAQRIGSGLSRLLSISAGDVDNDGDMDIIGGEDTDSRVALLKNTDPVNNTPTNNAFQSQVIDIGAAPQSYQSSVPLGDIDGDGDLDLVIRRSNELAVLLNDGNGSFAYPYLVPGPGTEIRTIILADLYNDGDVDALGTFVGGNFFISLNKNGQLTRLLTIDAPVQTTLCSATAADIDNDGDYDALGGCEDGNVYVSRNGATAFSDVAEFAVELQAYIDQCTPSSDDDANALCTVTLNISSGYEGTLFLTGLDIVYEYNATTIDLAQALNNYVSMHQTTEVPLEFSSSTAGIVEIVSQNIIYDAPWLVRPIEDQNIIEDSNPTKQIDLDEYFDDNNGTANLDYYVSFESDATRIRGTIYNNYMGFMIQPDWYGSAVFRVKAIDSDGYSAESDNFTVFVTPVNDAPRLIGLDSTKTVVENITEWLELDDVIYDVDNDDAELFVWLDPGSEHITVHQTNRSLEMRFSGFGYTIDVILKVRDPEGLSATQALDIFVEEFGTPVWTRQIPVIEIEEDNNITAYSENATDLNDYVRDDDDLTSELMFYIHSQTDPRINVSIFVQGAKDIVLVSIEPNYYGNNTVTVNVSDGEHDVHTTFLVMVAPVNDPPVYLGGLQSVSIHYGDTWSRDLDDYFWDVEDDAELTFERNYQHISIIRGNKAIWQPEVGASNLTGVVFNATDPQGRYAISEPIDLSAWHEPEPKRPIYIGGLKDAEIDLTEQAPHVWQVDLDDHFEDEDTPELTFWSNKDDIGIDAQTHEAVWAPDENSSELIDVIFYASDGSPQIANSTPINLTLRSKPQAKLTRIHPAPTVVEGTTVVFEGTGSTGVHYEIDGYLWSSDKDGELSRAKRFSTSGLSVGEHRITFKIHSTNGLWSDAVARNITVKERQEPPRPPDEEPYNWAYLSIAILFIVIGMISMLLRYRR